MPKIFKTTFLILTFCFLATGVLAMESSNYKISDDNLDFGKYQGAQDQFKINMKDIKGIANLGVITQRTVSWKIALGAGLAMAIGGIVYVRRFRRKNTL